PPHRVEHLAAAHALESRDRVGVGVGEHVPDVQRPRYRRRRGVDRVDLGPLFAAIERVRTLLGPGGGPLGLERLQGGLVRTSCNNQPSYGFGRFQRTPVRCTAYASVRADNSMDLSVPGAMIGGW